MSNEEDALTASLDLLRRLPPNNVSDNLDTLVNILPDLADDLLSSVDQPLRVESDKLGGGKDYLICDYNRDGDSYRSPWTNQYTPPLSDGTVPSPGLRKLEVAMNQAFDVYRDLYFEGGVSSVYLWDTDQGGFAGVVLIKKTTDDDSNASWDSVHVFESSSSGTSASSSLRTCSYKLTSTVMLYMSKPLSSSETTTVKGEVNLGGSMTRQHEATAPLDTTSSENLARSHIENLGKLVEDMEIKLRNLLSEVYFSKTKDILGNLRSLKGFGEVNKQRALQGELVGLLKGRKLAT
ncbi:F-actin-capping protein subunit beta [Sporobolomyces salmoneus]|uniref:F-actin-capping protein subunit beta n=1 Tax=Sporobolomyces salmoneus TaxID=183962 RepID=UPI00317ADB8B